MKFLNHLFILPVASETEENFGTDNLADRRLPLKEAPHSTNPKAATKEGSWILSIAVIISWG